MTEMARGFITSLALALAALGTLGLATLVVLALAARERRQDVAARQDMPLAYRDQAEHEAWVRMFFADDIDEEWAELNNNGGLK